MTISFEAVYNQLLEIRTDIGELKAQSEALKDDMDELKQDLAEQRKKIMWIGAAIIASAGGAGAVLQHAAEALK